MNNSKEINHLTFHLENCESIVIPYECFEKLSINNKDLDKLKDKDTIYNMECEIKDNGNIKYGKTWSDNETRPIDRLNQYDDIVQINVFYKNNTKIELTVDWYDVDNRNDNKNQKSDKIAYNTIHIKLEPYVKKYNIIDMLNFEIGTKFLDESNKEYEIAEDNKGKYIKGITTITEELVKMKFEKIAC